MYLGLDIGTSAVKAVLLDGNELVQQVSVPLEVSRLRSLWTEQAPVDWWRATEAAVAKLDPTSRRRVRAIGLAGQMHGAVLLDAADRVLRPAILWNDGRSHVECEMLLAAEPAMPAITGNAAMPGFTAPKLLWVRQHEPEVFAATAKVLLPKDYVRLMMTGDKATDVSDASGTMWLDTAARSWSVAMLAATGLDERHMPSLHEGNALTGTLTASVADRWGMARVPVAAGGGDNAAAAVGLGVVEANDAFLSLGTSGVIFVTTDRLRASPGSAIHAFAHTLPGRWHQMSVMLSAAACIDWAVALLRLADAAALMAAAERASGVDTPIFLPYLAGERTPHADPHAKGVLFGLTASTTADAVARAVVEGVAMGLRDGLDALALAGSEVTTIHLTGGGSISDFWIRLVAAALGRPLAITAGTSAAPALGAARLARLASTGDTVEQVCATGSDIRRIEPEPQLAAAFAHRQPAFRELYHSLKASFRT